MDLFKIASSHDPSVAEDSDTSPSKLGRRISEEPNP
jgi:hypothetical protein